MPRVEFKRWPYGCVEFIGPEPQHGPAEQKYLKPKHRKDLVDDGIVVELCRHALVDSHNGIRY